jgi:hypothetical protein
MKVKNLDNVDAFYENKALGVFYYCSKPNIINFILYYFTTTMDVGCLQIFMLATSKMQNKHNFCEIHQMHLKFLSCVLHFLD